MPQHFSLSMLRRQRTYMVRRKSLYVQVGLGYMTGQYGRATVIVRALRRGRNKASDVKLMRVSMLKQPTQASGEKRLRWDL